MCWFRIGLGMFGSDVERDITKRSLVAQACVSGVPFNGFFFWKWKFFCQVLIALAVAASGIRLTIFVDNNIFSYAVTVLWILTVTNAVNFQDNMNGLCPGLGIICGWFFAWHAGLEGQYLVASLAFLFSGALFGFFPFNFPKGCVFLGDGGSHVVGFLLSVLAVLPDFYSEASPYKWLIITPVLVLFIPILLILLNYKFNHLEKYFLILLTIVFFIATILSLYHLGIEQGFIQESMVCDLKSGSNLLSKEDILKQLQEKSVSCKDVTFKIFGLSLTTYNILISLLITIYTTKIYLDYDKN